MRINGFEQIKGFYSWVFENQDKNIRTTHISLYMFLINQNNRNNWVEWFKCPFDLAMSGSGITNKNTYYKTLADLQEWKLIEYKKGVNNYKAPLIKIEVLFDTATVPQSEPQLQPQVLPLPLPLLQPQLANNIKLLTNNLKLITVNVERVLDFLKSESDSTEKKEKHEKIEERDISPPPIMQDAYTYRNVESDFALNNQNANNNFEHIDWRAFCEKFNKETGKSVNAILPRTKQNIEQLMKLGYTKKHLVKAIHKAKENEYIKKNPKLLTPTHIFEPENFERYVT